MRVLWVSNILFPEADSLLGHSPSGLKSSGGWLLSAARELSLREGIELHVACPARVERIVKVQGEHIVYHLFNGLQPSGEPLTGDCPALDAVFADILSGVNPDIVDVHGTEYAHNLSCIRAAAGRRCVVTIQGLIFASVPHFRDGLDRRTIFLHGRPFHKGILHDERVFARRAGPEKELLRKATDFIGRTGWDREQTAGINPGARYHHCDETLREEFYSGCWEYSKCLRHSIFTSQGTYPVKGLHQLLKAMPAILREYPDAMLFVGGGNILESRGEYARIIAWMLRSLYLEDHVRFTGNLDAHAMKDRLLRSNVFVCPSTIENSPNSLGEAQLLGVPCVASRVGGIPTMIPDPMCGTMYPFEDTGELARLVCEVFACGDFDNTHMRDIARRRHAPRANCNRLIDIYKSLI